MVVLCRDKLFFKLILVVLLFISSCKNDDIAFISVKTKPIFQDNSAIVATYNNEIGIVDSEGFSNILKVEEEISAIFEFNNYIVAIANKKDNSKIVYKLDKDGKLLDSLMNLNFKFNNYLQYKDTIYLLGSSLHKLYSHEKLEFRNDIGLSEGDKISIIKKITSENNVFLLDEFFIQRKEDIIKLLNKSAFFNPTMMDLYSPKTFAIYVSKNKVINFKRDTVNSNVIDIIDRTRGKVINDFQFKVKYPNLRSDDDNIIAFNMKELEVYHISKQKKILDINSSKFFIVDATIQNDMLVLLTINSLVRIPLHNSSMSIKGLQNKQLLRDFNAHIEWIE